MTKSWVLNKTWDEIESLLALVEKTPTCWKWHGDHIQGRAVEYWTYGETSDPWPRPVYWILYCLTHDNPPTETLHHLCEEKHDSHRWCINPNHVIPRSWAWQQVHHGLSRDMNNRRITMLDLQH